MDDLGPLAYARCHRIWPVYLYWPLRRCGDCGVQPELVLDRHGQRVTAEVYDEMRLRVLARTPDMYPDSFADHVVNDYLLTGYTNCPALDAFL